MQLGITIPPYGPLATGDSIRAIAEQGEALGFTLMAVPDHVVIPKQWAHRYPYTTSGHINSFDSGEHMEPLTVMAALASMTKKARLVSSVLVLPYREPILTTKILTTIDILSGGRVVLGCGTGWMEEEFEAVGAPPFAARGQVTDEYIDAFKEMWTNDEPEYRGEYTKVDNIYFRPGPVQKPHPPVWVGGDSMPALRRTAKRGNGWYPVGLAPKNPIFSVARYGEEKDKLQRLTEEAGRSIDEIELTFWAVWYSSPVLPESPDGSRHLLVGEPGEVAADIAGLGDLGVTSILMNFNHATLEETLGATERFAKEVMSQVDLG